MTRVAAAGEAPAALGAAVAAAQAMLAAAGVPQARREARLVAAAALGLEPASVLGWPERSLTGEDAARVALLARRRAAGEPLSRLTGRREFWSLSFALSPATLDPRPDTETLVEAALAVARDRADALHILDLGTGSGCVLLALLSEVPQAKGVGIDRSADAATQAARNARALGLSTRASFVAADWAAPLRGRFDLVVSNPPYIERGAIAGLAVEVRAHDPLLALDGGPDGLDAYRALAAQIPHLLAPGGRAVLEIGAGQAASVQALMKRAGLVPEAIRHDLNGVERCLVLSGRAK